ncbi:MAG: peptide deformylase [Deltaproteobacteria bacterium]|nr:peptide deformylase [Deltaproteobacteria bacterium]
MPTLRILTYPDPFLKKEAGPIETVDEQIVTLANDMLETMYNAPGVGLAAPQVGEDKRLVVIDVNQKEGGQDPLVLINPEVVDSDGEVVYEEGCLSVPDCLADIKRAERVRVRGLDLEGNPVDIEADDLLAIALQHEIDHLNGVLIIDRISPLKRELYRRKVRKALKEKQANA